MRRPPGFEGGAGEQWLRRQVAREAYQRRLRAQSQAEGAAVARQAARLDELGVSADLLGIPIETAVELVDEWVRLLAMYPAVAGVWRGDGPDIELVHLGTAEPMGYGGGRMLWNALCVGSSRPTLDGMLRGAVEAGEHPQGCGNVRALACHELGHAMEEVIRLRLAGDEWRALGDALAECRVSRYATRKPEEGFAIAFTAMHHGRDLSDGAARAVDVVRQVIRDVVM